jgi:glycosyltransferase involved in cell wall biosynthesis
VGVFTSSILDALHRRADLAVSAFAVSWRTRQQLGDLVPGGVSTEQRAMPARPLTRLWARTNLARAERFIGDVDVVHGTNFTVPPTRRAGQVVTVHDLTFLRYPELCLPDTLRYPALIRRALRRGAVVHTPSTYVAEEVRDQFSVAPNQVVAVHSGIPALAAPDEIGAREVVEGDRPYILSIGTAEPRKDLPGLVRAFSELAAAYPDLLLVLAGPPGWGSDALDEAIDASGLVDRIIQPGYLTPGVLSALLSRARVLAYPSLYEGFGFPPLQAMTVGVPVVTTRAGALSEIVGGASLMVEPLDTVGLARALEIAVSDEAQRSVLIAAGKTRVKDFSWDQTAEGLAQIYRRVAPR